MARERLTVEQMEEKYPNKWLFIIKPKCHKGTTQLKSGIVQVESISREDVYNASRTFRGNAAIRFIGKLEASEQRPKMTSYRPRNFK